MPSFGLQQRKASASSKAISLKRFAGPGTAVLEEEEPEMPWWKKLFSRNKPSEGAKLPEDKVILGCLHRL